LSPSYDDVRGLEHQLCTQRQRRKYIAIHAMLEAQRRLQVVSMSKEDKLACVSHKFSNWARDEARRAGLTDEQLCHIDYTSTTSNKDSCTVLSETTRKQLNMENGVDSNKYEPPSKRHCRAYDSGSCVPMANAVKNR